MKNEMIGDVLKACRTNNNYTIKDVQRLLKERYINVAEKTIYSWESGRSQPDADTLLVLCDIYDIRNILNTFGYSKTQELCFSQSEEQLIINYRKHPELHYAIKVLLGV